MKQVIRGLVGAVCLAASAVVAEDGVWTSALGGLWSDDANWADGVVAMDGGLAGFEAPGGSVQVTNDVPGLSLTGLSFNTVAGNAAGWLFDGGTVYLSGNAVADVAAGRAEFNVSVQSSGAFAKTGAGALFLEGGLVCTDGVTLWDGVMEVRSGRELGTARFNWAGGTVKVVPGVAGVQESASPNGNINLGTFGTNTMVTLDLRMAPITDEQAYPYNTQYIYRGRWYAPQDGLYSFVKDFDDQGYLAIDNVVILNNGGWNDFIVVRDVPLREGWHDIDIRVAQGTGGVGPQKGTPYGIMYDPTNGDFSSFASAVAFIDPGDGSVLRTDVQTCIAPLILLTGDVTLDASAMPTDYTPTLLRGVQTNSAAASVPKLTVTGGDGRLLIGSQTLIGTIPSHAVFNADADAANGVLFGNKVALYRLPTCDWEILPRADILIGTDGILGTGPLALTNYNVRIISENALGGPYPIAVRGEGARIIFDPTESVNGDWGNGITLTLAHDVSLEGVASAARFSGRGTCYFDGVISGAGSLIKDSGSTVHLRETNTFEGDVQISGGRLNVYAPTIGAYTNPVVITSGATLSFNAVVEEAYVHDLSGTSGTVDIPAGQTLTLASLSMEALNVTGAGTLCVSNMTPTVRFSINGNIRLDVPDTAEIPYISLGNENITLTLTGCATLGSALGNGIIIKRGDTALTFTGAAAFDGDFVIEDGTVALDLTSTAPCEAAALWLDAADATSLDHHRNGDAVDPDKDIISRWYDKRVNGRYAEVDNYEGAQNYDRPYLLEDACNGLPVMSFGNFADPPEFHEYRRMKFNNTLNCTRVIMVFGSQQGGGHILGMTGANPIDTTFMRGGIETDETPPVASDPIWADATYPVRMDGTAVDGLSTGLSGGYQILNITLSPAHNINVIGELNSWHNAGGQRYAEALFFTSTVSDGEARVIEAYLGNKWGIPAGRVGAFTVRSGATLTVDGAVQIDSLRGDGTLVKTGTGALRLGGHFSGTIDLQGGTLEPADLPTPPSAESIPTDNTLFWLDACETNLMTFGPFDTQVFQWIDRRPGANRFAYGFYSDAWRERPWLIHADNPRGGDPLPWVDFYPNTAINPPDDSNGKYMKIAPNTDPDGYEQDTQGTQGEINGIRTGLVVLHTIRGGGMPLSRDFTRDAPVPESDAPGWDDASAPIWGSGTSGNVLNGKTYLDGIPVNGRQDGFTSNDVQVLSFTTTGNTIVNFLAHSRASLERLGEVILFNTVLPNDTRRACEAYLLSKWKGQSANGYHHPGDLLARAVNLAPGATLDLTPFSPGEIGAITSAGGNLRVTDFAGLPPITGSINDMEAVSGSLTLDITTAGASPTVSVTGTLTLPAEGTLTLNFIGKVSPGTVTLLSYGALAGDGLLNWTLNLTGDVPKGAVIRLRQGATSTAVEIIQAGTVLMLK